MSWKIVKVNPEAKNIFKAFSDQSKDREKRYTSKLNKDELNYAYQRCLDKGFLEMDSAIDFGLLKQKSLQRLDFCFLDSCEDNGIHPITFLVTKEEKFYMIQTKTLMQNPSSILSQIKDKN